uniref:hypothetical protein n=1 Tax=Roseibium sp. TaxID=1936156 RepID=UPI003D117D5F
PDIDTGKHATQLSLRAAGPLLFAATACVIALGIFQETYTRLLGEETILRGMPQIALDGEHNVGAWFSSALMTLSALALYLAGRAQRDIPGGRTPLPWYALAVIFVGLSIDESASFHEILGDPLRNTLGTGGFLYFAWVIPGAIFTLAVGILFIPFLLSLPRGVAVRFIVAGAIFVGGALGMELLEGKLADEGKMGSVLFMVFVIIEEAMEMFGIALFLSTVVAHLVSIQPNWRLVR